ncbi:beta 1-4 rhamnosyltransferase Cps2T [Streptococcus cameli]
MKHIFIIGSRGLPATYGGFETFVEELISHQASDQIQYHVACLSETEHQTHSQYKGADCFTIKPPQLGPARVIAYDMMAIHYGLQISKKQGIKDPLFYVLGNTIGAFIAPFARSIHQAGGKLFVNPDGLEWKRSKWPKPVQAYLKYSEKWMSKYADLLVSDNQGIEEYIMSAYPWAKTVCIAYGTDCLPTTYVGKETIVRDLFRKWGIQEKEYYLILGRFVPENNYETMIREFMLSQTQRDLVIICNHEGNAYFETLKETTQFETDERVKFVGTVYDKDLVKYIRQEARAYIHGHEVGGTNPGLLEALSQTNENLVLGVDFNKKVALDTARYWSKEKGSLRGLINEIDQKEEDCVRGQKAKQHMQENYTWEGIVHQYEDLFLR